MIGRHLEQVTDVLRGFCDIDIAASADEIKQQVIENMELAQNGKGVDYYLKKLSGGFRPCIRELKVIRLAAEKLRQRGSQFAAFRRPVNPHEEMQHVVSLLEQDLDAIGIEVKWDKDNGLGVVECSPTEMFQVFMNLIRNAIDAIKEKMSKGWHKTTTEKYRPQIRITTRRRTDVAEMRFWDNGAGICKDLLDQIFNPFFTTKPPDKGTGMGLSIANEIVKNHDGQLAVNSKEGEYTEFVILLPVQKRDNGNE